MVKDQLILPSVDMDGLHGHEYSFMSLSSGGSGRSANDFSYDYIDDPNPLFPMAAGRSTSQHIPRSLSQWIEFPQTPQSYVEFLTENLEKVPAADVLESIGSPVDGLHSVDAISGIQRELQHRNEGKAFSFGPDDCSFESEDGLKLSAYTTNISNDEASASERFSRPHDGLCLSKISSSQYEPREQQNHAFWIMKEPKLENSNLFQLQPEETISASSFLPQPHYSLPRSRAAGSDCQNHAFWMKEPKLENSNVFQLRPEETISAPSFLPQPHYSIPKSRAAGSDCQNHAFWMKEPKQENSNVFQLQPEETISAPSFPLQPHYSQPKSRPAGTEHQRKPHISERIKALQELLPYSAERCQATALDDIIDHVKFLQLQMKELSRSRLGGEQTSNPFVFLEGYGHYVIHEQMINEPLDEMMGTLLEINPSAAAQLLESKGLYMIPNALVNSLL